MKVKIKYIGRDGVNYTRLGREIPKEEKEIVLEEYFPNTKHRIEFVYGQLKADENIEIKLSDQLGKEKKEAFEAAAKKTRGRSKIQKRLID